MQAAPRHSASPRVEAIAAWLIAALILAGGGIVARLIVDYPRLLPNSYIGFLIYRAGPTIALLWACAGAAIAINAATTRLDALVRIVRSQSLRFSLSPLLYAAVNVRPWAAPCRWWQLPPGGNTKGTRPFVPEA